MELTALNKMDQDAFTRALADIFEHSSWIPEATWQTRPFVNLEDLHAKLCQTLENSTEDRKLALIRAHPDLAGKLAVAGELTEFSNQEQQSARLDKLTPEQFDRISKLNQRYKDTFEFPFIICVKEHTQEGIFKHFEKRVNHDPETERQAALFQICRIAWHRLNALIDQPEHPNLVSAKLSTHVLDTMNGKPAPGVTIDLFEVTPSGDQLIKTVVTNHDGRTDAPLFSAEEMKTGDFKLLFHIGDYFYDSADEAPFLTLVPVQFRIQDASAGYHVPLLASPWSYSVYRGS